MNKALRIRKVLGGGMRQAGYLAAAALYALEHHIDRLAEDHRRAREIGAVLQELPFVKKVVPVETNIVIFELNDTVISEREFLEHLRRNGIRLTGMGNGRLRMVTHLDYTDSMHGHVLALLGSYKEIGV